jgi:hypothetical protein
MKQLHARPVRYGTQDFIEIDALRPWKLCEWRLFAETVARRSGRSLQRVAYVVNMRCAMSSRPFLAGVKYTNSTDFQICRATLDLFAEMERRPDRWARMVKRAQRQSANDPRRWARLRHPGPRSKYSPIPIGFVVYRRELPADRPTEAAR